MSRKKIVGITVLAFGDIAIGSLGAFFALICWMFLLGMADPRVAMLGNIKVIVFIFCAGLATLVPLMTICLGLGMLFLKRWAWVLHLWLYPFFYLYIYYFFLFLTEEMPTSFFAKIIQYLPFYFWILTPIVIVCYLLKPRIKELFVEDNNLSNV